jgi:hypothetical protein
MDEAPPVADGFVRIAVKLPRGESYTPGELTKLAGVDLEALGPIVVNENEARVDVRVAVGKTARASLERVGPTRLEGWSWRWLRLGVGRNHGLSIGQLKKIMQAADALPLGRIQIQNTHSLVGIQDFKLDALLERLAPLRVNGFAARATALPKGAGPGSAAFIR